MNCIERSFFRKSFPAITLFKHHAATADEVRVLGIKMYERVKFEYKHSLAFFFVLCRARFTSSETISMPVILAEGFIVDMTTERYPDPTPTSNILALTT